VNDDWVEFLEALGEAGARYLVVGAHALAVHGVPRATQDLDVWIDREPANVRAVVAGLKAFGAPLDALQITAADLEREDQVIQIGVPPNRIDVLTSMSGLPVFRDAWERRMEQPLRGQQVPFLGLADLLSTKRATGRQKDLGDIEALGKGIREP
jgi:hypothetical protein